MFFPLTENNFTSVNYFLFAIWIIELLQSFIDLAHHQSGLLSRSKRDAILMLFRSENRKNFWNFSGYQARVINMITLSTNHRHPSLCNASTSFTCLVTLHIPRQWLGESHWFKSTFEWSIAEQAIPHQNQLIDLLNSPELRQMYLQLVSNLSWSPLVDDVERGWLCPSDWYPGVEAPLSRYYYCWALDSVLIQDISIVPVMVHPLFCHDQYLAPGTILIRLLFSIWKMGRSTVFPSSTSVSLDTSASVTRPVTA